VLLALALFITAATALIDTRVDGWWPLIRISPPVRRAAPWVAAGVVLIAVVAWNPVERFNEFRKPPAANAAPGVTELSSHGRWQFWKAAVDAFESQPVRGLGAGGFEEYWAQHGTIQRFVRNPHSLPLQQAAELGLIGLIPLAGLLAAIGSAAWRRLSHGRRRDPAVLLAVIVTAAVGAAVDWTWQFPVVIGPAVICAALLTSSSLPKLLTGGGRRLGLAAMVAGWIALAAASMVAIGELEHSRSRDAASAGNLDSAVARARDARDVEPWSGAPYTQLALVEERRRDIPLALAYLHAAQVRDSEDWRLYLIEARLQTRLGNKPAAKRAALHARHLSGFLLSGGSP
jgi:O-antigen ligase